MEIIEIDKILPYIKHTVPIGMGMTAICFKNMQNVIIKVYKKNDEARLLVDNNSFLDKLANIGRISNETYIGPDTILIHDGKVIGYLYPYIKAKVLAHVPKNTKLSTLFGNYGLLIKDTKQISDEYLRLYDVHDRNILFNGNFYVIDLDKSNFKDDTSFNFTSNMSTMFYNIMRHIYGTKPWELIHFSDTSIDRYINHLDKCDADAVNEFLKLLSERCEEADPSIGTIKSKVKAYNEYNSYYKLF